MFQPFWNGGWLDFASTADDLVDPAGAGERRCALKILHRRQYLAQVVEGWVVGSVCSKLHGENRGKSCVGVCFFDLDCDFGAAPNLWLLGDWIWIEPNKMKEYEGIEQREKDGF